MSNKPSSPAQQARLEKQKIASTEGAKAMADREAQAIAVRQNMERLRALRLAKEAEEGPRAPAAKTPSRKKAASGSGPKAKAEPLSQWLATQRASGRER